MGVNPYVKYQQTQIETADQGKLLLMLYDGALRFLGRARKTLAERDLQGSNNNLVRVQDIIAELMSSLDLEAGEVAVSLFRLYEYMHYLLVQANIKKDAAPLDQVEGMLAELRDTWKGALGLAGVADIQKPAQGAPLAEKMGAAPENAKQAGNKAEGPAAYDEGRHGDEAPGKGYKKVNISG